MNGAYLNGLNVTVGPLNGYLFSKTPEGSFKDSVIITEYGGSSFIQDIYVKFTPLNTGTYNGDIPVRSRGNTDYTVPVKGVAVNSSPDPNAEVIGISCNSAKNGAINLSPAGGIPPFVYSWQTVIILNLLQKISAH